MSNATSSRVARRVLCCARASLIAVVVVVLAASACSEGDTSRVDEAAEHVELDCSGAVSAVAEPDAAIELVEGVVGFGVTHPAHQVGSRTIEVDGLEYRFSKLALFVRTGARAVIRVAEDQDVGALLGWPTVGGDKQVSEDGELVVPGCFDDLDQWSIFAGGVWVASPACIELRVESEEGATTGAAADWRGLLDLVSSRVSPPLLELSECPGVKSAHCVVRSRVGDPSRTGSPAR